MIGEGPSEEGQLELYPGERHFREAIKLRSGHLGDPNPMWLGSL